jgi:signal transduction histidine kinase
LHEFVTLHPDLPSYSPAPERPGSDSPTFAALRRHVADVLRRRSTELAKRWEGQARSVALLERDGVATADRTAAAALVDSFASALAADGAVADEVVPLGLAYGIDAFDAGASLHHMLKGLDLLSAMTLYAAEGALADWTGAEVGAVDGVRLSRRLQQVSSLSTLAAAKGYTQAVNDGLRDRFRHLRHDLRNPLGTIKSVLALMDDETVPADARSSPRFRAMATRQARSLDEMIVSRLSDSAALLPALALQSVPLRTVACAVRRDLRAEATARSVSVIVANTRLHVRVDAVGLELMLYELLLAALHEAAAGDELMVAFADVLNGRVTVRLECAPARPPVARPEALRRLGALTSRMGATLVTGQQLLLSLPVQEGRAEEVEAAVASPTERDRSEGGESRHDLRGARQREHGQSGAL